MLDSQQIAQYSTLATPDKAIESVFGSYSLDFGFLEVAPKVVDRVLCSEKNQAYCVL